MTKILPIKEGKQTTSVILPPREDAILLQFGGSREDIMKFYNKFESLKRVGLQSFLIFLKEKNFSTKKQFIKPHNEELNTKVKSVKVHEELSKLIFYCQSKGFDEESKK